jgi:hypothetical protein
MAALVAGTQALTRRAQSERLRGEAHRLRRALVMSLQALRALHEGNLRGLAAGKSPLASGRHQITLLRIHLGRLMSLDEAEIEAVMAASIAAERVETAMSIAGKPAGGLAFTLPVEDDGKEAVRSALRETCSMFKLAECLLVSSGMPRNGETPRVPVSEAQGLSDDTGPARACPAPRGAIPE